MKPALIALLTLFATSTCAAQSRFPSSDSAKSTPSTVAGTVVKLADSVPLPSSTVRLQSIDDHSHTFSGVTDAAGHFEIKGIDPGRYRLRVIRNGYITQEYGQKTPHDAGATLDLRSGQEMKELLFRMLPAAVISGRIQNENGDPLPWVRVSALRSTYARGKRTLSIEVTVVTNDLGEYRLFGLGPGRYFVSASYRPGQRLEPLGDDDDSEAAGKLGYVPTYYPGTTDPARATSLGIKEGDEISSTDFLLQPTAVYNVRGRVNPFGPRGTSNGVILTLEPRSTGLGWNISPRQTVVDKPDGAFEIQNVLPGSYTLTAFLFDDGRRYQARQSVEVTNFDAEGLQLSPLPGMDVRGQITWEPKPSLDKNTLVVNARPADSTFQFGAQAVVAANGTFSLRELPEGLYRLTPLGQSPDCYLKSIRYAGMEVSDGEFNVVRGTQAVLDVTISARGARVQGTVKDVDGLPAVGVWVVLVPDEAHRADFRLFKYRPTDQYGRFDLRGIPPGDYQLYSWEEVELNAWDDPDFLKPFEPKAQSLSLQESTTKFLDLVAIRTTTQPHPN